MNAAKEVLGSKAAKPKWDGTPLSGFVTAKENRPPRECGNCKYYKNDACYQKQVMKDPKVPDRKSRLNSDGSISVDDKDCCNFFTNKTK